MHFHVCSFLKHLVCTWACGLEPPMAQLPDEEHEVWRVGQHEGGLVPPSAISSSSEGLQLGEQSDSGSDVGDDQMVMLGEHTTQNTSQNTHVDLFGSSRGGGMSSTPLPQCFFILYNATMRGLWRIHVWAWEALSGSTCLLWALCRW